MGENRNIPISHFRDLNLSNYFLFGEVMQDEDTCKAVLEIILRRKISQIRNLSKERHIDADNLHKGIRLDVYFEDERNTVYSIEMQNRNRCHLPKRSRHYQGIIDSKMLPSGKIDYAELKDGIIIFICTFDPFDRGRYRYTFENRCLEEPDLCFGDGTRKVFLNTDGQCKEGEEIEPELIEFLSYLKDTVNVVPKTELVQRIARRVELVKQNAESEVRYMTTEIFCEEMRQEGRELGLEEGRALGRKQGLEKGELLQLIRLTLKKYVKGMDASEVAELFEENESVIQSIYDAVKQSASQEPEKIYDCMTSEQF